MRGAKNWLALAEQTPIPSPSDGKAGCRKPCLTTAASSLRTPPWLAVVTDGNAVHSRVGNSRTADEYNPAWPRTMLFARPRHAASARDLLVGPPLAASICRSNKPLRPYWLGCVAVLRGTRTSDPIAGRRPHPPFWGPILIGKRLDLAAGDHVEPCRWRRISLQS